MTDLTPSTTTNLDVYGHEALEWDRARAALSVASADHTWFLGTCGDVVPHAAGVGAQWLDGDLWFPSGPRTRKSRDLAANPSCTLAAHLPGIDLTLTGSAHRVTDPATLERVATGYRDVHGWPAQVDGDGLTAPFSAPSAGPPPWHLFRFTFHTAVGVAGAEPHGATRWRFER